MPKRVETGETKSIQSRTKAEGRIGQDWPKILEQIRTPLAFFGLALLVLMATMGTVITMNRGMNAFQFYSLCLMALMFLGIVGVVSYLTVKWPQNLLDKVEENKKDIESIERFLETPAFRDVIIGIVRESVDQKVLIPKRQGSPGDKLKPPDKSTEPVSEQENES